MLWIYLRHRNVTNIASSSQCHEHILVILMWHKYPIIMWKTIPNLAMWMSSIVLVNHGYGQPWSPMDKNFQTWLTTFNHGKPHSIMVMVNQGLPYFSFQCDKHYIVITMWQIISNVTIWMSSIVLVNHGHGQPWSAMDKNFQTWLTIINHGQPQSIMGMVNQVQP
jgi:hypothetical protein